MSTTPDGTRDVDVRAAAERATFRQGMAFGVVLGISLVCLAGAYAMGAFDRPPPPRDATPCGDRTVDIDGDPENCGYCGNTCPAELPVCRYGSCDCPNEGGTYCSDAEPCTDLDADPRHCGECGHSCDEGVACVSGECVCDDGLTACDRWNSDEGTHVTSCVDTQSDPHHCGACHSFCSTDRGGGCREGVCDCGERTSCAVGINPPNCVDTQTDGMHCGECNHDCGDRPCVAGVCG